MKIIWALILILTLILAAAFYVINHRNQQIAGPIVFFGDSLTSGFGAEKGQDFPTLIGQALNVQIINAGVSGDTTQAALKRIDTDVIAKNPKIIVVELGGNDFLQQIPFETTQENFEQIMQKFTPTSAKLVVVSTKTSPFQDKYEKYLEDLSKKYDAKFVPDILKGVITNPELKSDEIHPNAAGYKIIAERLSKVLRNL